MPEVVTLGETMVLMNPRESGPMKYITEFKKQVGGAESNFAIGLSRLGHKTGWFSKLGDDPHGKFVKSFIQGEGVDTSKVVFTHDPTGVYFKERRTIGESHAYYYRHGSAASTMKPDDLPENYIKNAQHLHLTGITPALSDSCLRTVNEAFELAQEGSVTVSFDPNLRLKLWSKKEMRNEVPEINQKSDIVVISENEGSILYDTSDPEEIVQEITGPEAVIVTLGERGAYIEGRNPYLEKKEESEGYVEPYEVENVVDTVGAGDAFAAGLISGLIQKKSLVESAKLANAVGAFATTVKGDVEGLPTTEELEQFIGENETVTR